MDALTLEAVAVGPLREINLTVRSGEVVCLSGASGSGKSRLLRAIADLEPHAGRILLGDLRQDALAADRWRARVMLVPAESSWWGSTVAEHFLEPVPGSLEGFGLSPAVMDWDVARLSSGEKQRLGVLRALSRRPRALLLDEPTANLDTATTRRVEQWLRSHARREGVPILWVAHDPEQISRVGDRHFTIRGSGLREGGCRTG